MSADICPLNACEPEDQRYHCPRCYGPLTPPPGGWPWQLDDCEDQPGCPAPRHHHDCPKDTGSNCDAPGLH